jgi:uncharacterized protein (TIGR00369 family)
MSEGQPSAGDLVRAFMEHSPFGRVLNLELDEIEPDRAVLSLPFDESLATYGDVVHGGAVASLIDVAATAAAWSAAEITDSPRGATVSMTVDYLRAARGERLTARARVTRRGSSLCFCDVEVAGPDGELVAKGLVTYKLG